jgi:hypothetical protein
MTQMAISTFIVSAAVSVAAGLMGAFALMRRMTLAADALSHVALPGIALALMLRVDPLAGAVLAPSRAPCSFGRSAGAPRSRPKRSLASCSPPRSPSVHS